MKIIYYITLLILISTSSIFIHELYHYITLINIKGFGICLEDGNIAYVIGKGYSSEIIAYIIQLSYISLITLILLINRRIK